MCGCRIETGKDKHNENQNQHQSRSELQHLPQIVSVVLLTTLTKGVEQDRFKFIKGKDKHNEDQNQRQSLSWLRCMSSIVGVSYWTASTLIAELPQLGVFRLGLLEDWDVGVGVFPKG